MVDAITEKIIDRAIADVAAYTSNPDNAPSWYVNIKSVNWRTPKPLRVGSQIDFVARFLGRELSYTYEVIEMNDRKFVMKTAEGPFPMETTYEWSPINESSTRMTLRNRGNPTGFSRLFAPFMSSMMKRANNKDLTLLKKILEQG